METVTQILSRENSFLFGVDSQLLKDVKPVNQQKRKSSEDISHDAVKKKKIERDVTAFAVPLAASSPTLRRRSIQAIKPSASRVKTETSKKQKEENAKVPPKSTDDFFNDSIPVQELLRVCDMVESVESKKSKQNDSGFASIKYIRSLRRRTEPTLKPNSSVSAINTKTESNRRASVSTATSVKLDDDDEISTQQLLQVCEEIHSYDHLSKKSSQDESHAITTSASRKPLNQSVLNEIKAAESIDFSTPILTQVVVKIDEGTKIVRNPVTCSQYIHETFDSLDSLDFSIATKRQRFYAAKPPITNRIQSTSGTFFGLGGEFKQHLLRVKNIPKLYDWQEECLQLDAIEQRRNLLYALPTSGGKTLVSEILMFREIMLRKKNVMFILPYVSIVQEKINDLLPFAIQYDFLVEEYCSGKGKIPAMQRRKKNSIYVCTMEKANILIDSLIEAKRLEEIGLIVVDELHMIGDSSRGYILELLLAKMIHLKTTPIQIVGMSATISNLNEVADFFHADIYTRDFRPVELQEYLKIGADLYQINTKATSETEVFQLVDQELTSMAIDKIVKRDPDLISPVIYESVREQKSCLIFCSTKKNCENVAMLLADCFPSEVKAVNRREKIKMIDAMKTDTNGNMCPVLARCLPYGIAYHHSALTSDERRHIEDAFRHGVVNVICCTSTLAAGVNLPASRVVIRSPYVGRDFITLSKYKQMIGRAGRAGIVETGESILFCSKKDYESVKKMMTSRMDATVSGYLERQSIVRACILNMVGLRVCVSVNELLKFCSCLLASVQEEKYGKSMREIFTQIIKELLSEGALVHKATRPRGSVNALEVKINGSNVRVNYCDELDIEKLGRAAVKAGVTLEDAKCIEKDLRKASENLVISQCLHLLYIVAPRDACDTIMPDWKNYHHIFMGLSQSMLHTANAIGITERIAMRMITATSFSEPLLTTLKRFYIALVLSELWNGKDLFEVAKKYKVDRGIVHKLMQMASSQAYTTFKLCEVFEEFWVFREILETFSQRLSHCCTTDLLPLMELPCIKLGRAKQMYSMGIRSVCDVASHLPEQLMSKLGNINSRQACMIVRAAQHAVNEQIDNFRAQMFLIAEGAKRKM